MIVTRKSVAVCMQSNATRHQQREVEGRASALKFKLPMVFRHSQTHFASSFEEDISFRTSHTSYHLSLLHTGEILMCCRDAVRPSVKIFDIGRRNRDVTKTLKYVSITKQVRTVYSKNLKPADSGSCEQSHTIRATAPKTTKYKVRCSWLT